MDKVKNVLDLINSGTFTKPELHALYENTLKFPDITEEERERIIEAVETELRVKFPAAAKKLFGSKDSQARDILSKVYQSTSDAFDLSENKLKNGVKSGGDMIAGRTYVDVYISYKNANGEGVALGLLQSSPTEELLVLFRRYRTGRAEAGIIKEYKTGMDQFDEAAQSYKDALAGLLAPA